MKALVFGVDPGLVEAPGPSANRLAANLAITPMALLDIDDPTVRGDDWAVLRTGLAGICGSDSKQVLLDFDEATDNPMTALISFPQVLGHEVVARVEEAGPAAGVEGCRLRVIVTVAQGDATASRPWTSRRPMRY